MNQLYPKYDTVKYKLYVLIDPTGPDKIENVN